jgi:hypothetical protein
MANGEDGAFLLGIAAGFIDTIYFETSFIESLSVSVILASIGFYCNYKEGQTLEIETQAFVRQNECLQKEWEDASRTWCLKGKQVLQGMSSTFNSESCKKRYDDLSDSLGRACLTAPIFLSGNIDLNLKLYLELNWMRSDVQKGKWNKFPEVVDAWKDFEKSSEKLDNLRRKKELTLLDPRLDNSRFLMSNFLYMFTFPYLFLVGIFGILGMLFL